MDNAKSMADVGWHPDWGLPYYLGIDAVSSSRLRLLRKSPLHLRHDIDNPRPPSEAMILGSATHAAILEPDTFHDHYTLAGQCEAELSSGKRKGQQCGNPGRRHHAEHGWRCGQHFGALEQWDATKTVLEPDDHARILGMMAAVHAHPKAQKFLSAIGETEVSAVFMDAETGLRCKIRPDKLVRGWGVDLSLKTARDASESFFRRELYSRGYFIAAALYKRGLESLGMDWKHRVEVVVETEPPYAVAVYPMRPDAIEAGAQLVGHLLRRYAECIESGSWPGLNGDKVTEISLPAYAWSQIDEETAGAPVEAVA